MECSVPEVQERYVQIANAIGVECATDDEAIEGLLRAIRDLKRRLGEPATIRDAGITDEEFQTQLDGLVDRAMLSASTPTCPRIPSADDYRKLFICAFSGQRVSF
jgi:alcohol dehydrogenase class IV